MKNLVSNAILDASFFCDKSELKLFSFGAFKQFLEFLSHELHVYFATDKPGMFKEMKWTIISARPPCRYTWNNAQKWKKYDRS